jgi:hypothetical protein
MSNKENLKKEIEELIYYNKREIEKLKIVFSEMEEEFKKLKKENEDLFNLINSYFKDLLYFDKQKEIIKTFELSNYLWGYLDCLANLGLIKPNKKVKKWFKIE